MATGRLGASGFGGEATVPFFAARLLCELLLSLITAAQAEPPTRVLMLHPLGAVIGHLYAQDMRAQAGRPSPARLHLYEHWRVPARAADDRQDAALARHLGTQLVPDPLVSGEQTAWQLYRWQILIVATALVLQAAWIVRLLLDRRRRRRAEIAAHQQMAELAELNRRATVEELSASIAHELTQQLSAISYNAEAAALVLRARSPDLGELRDIVTAITRDQRSATEVIQRLRDQLGKIPCEIEQIDLNEVVREVFEFLSAMAAARRVSMTTHVAAQALHVSGDRKQLQQVVLNLVANGIDALGTSPKDERSIVGRTALVEGATAEVTIEDSGPGIPSAKAEQMFEPFFTTKAGGMGMGLAIARTIIESHRGRIWAESRPEGGGLVRFSLPLAVKEAEGLPAHSFARHEQPAR
jgi:signal transduction histidine kinase